MANPVPSVLITGASRGLGRAMAVAFAKNGYAVGINYHADDAAATDVANEIKKQGGKGFLLKCDVTSSRQVSEMIQTFVGKFGRLDVLINNAGNVRNRTIAKMTDEEWRDVMAADLDAPFYCARAAIPFMRKQNDGSILNIASFIAARGARGAGNYAAAKAGLISLTKTLAIEEGRNNIRSNAIFPGFHVTDMNRGVWEKMEKEIRAQHLLSDLPSRDEMADFVVKIANLKTVTGQVFAFESRIL